ncbi:Protein kinase-like domain protein [Colletotrichum karsti]|uniref:Protein kinase-like domain protein n=1 Tax=Colletotrichum karsti TaxID=1095194 RepID=A0A9P6I1F0_9PEZI|nr:Protein kinase-like domain protein [Colletotrichum karsti]KAF9874042.1 Protein kinase-like domain protein [Colletotrichum karsti]
MMDVNVNHAGFERRLSVVRQLLHDLGLQASTISTLAYDEEYAFPFNNFLFKVELAAPAFTSSFPGTQPGTCKAPSEGVSTLVIKLSNPAAHDVNNANRVANDVASQYLVRESMAKAGLPPLVPDVYAWAPATTTDEVDEKGFGWIMSEFRSGVDLGPEFSSLDVEDQKHVLEQMAAVLGAMQAADLPEGVTKFGGGLGFDSDGYIVSGESPSMQDVKPAGSYAEWRIEKLRSRLERAAGSPVIQGWKSSGVATRIEKFLTSGGPERLLSTVDVHRKCITHGDLTIYNMLFDKKAKKVTAVLDFDFASVSHPFEEFISISFTHTGGNIGDYDIAINRAILSGDFTTPPADLHEESAKEWELAKTWNTVLQESAALAPSQIEGVDQIYNLMQLEMVLCPYRLSSARAVGELDNEEKARLRGKAEADLVGWLEKHGY